MRESAMTTRKLLFLSHYGAHAQFHDFFSAIAKLSGAQVKVILPKKVIYQNGYQTAVFPNRKIVDGVEYIPSNLLNPRNYLLSGYLPHLPWVMLTWRPDAVVVTDDVYTVDAFWVIVYKLLFFLTRTRIVTWSQAAYLEDPKAIRKPARPLLWWNRKFVHHFVARNEIQAAAIRRRLPPGNEVQVVYWNTNPEQFTRLDVPRHELAERLGVPREFAQRRLLGFVGRVVPEKGILEVVQALSALPNDVGLITVGGGDSGYIGEIQAAANRNGVADRVLMLGPKPYDLLVSFYNLIDVFLLPTRDFNGYYELFGRVIPEAMMTRTLVFGSDNGAIPEVIGNPNLVFRQNDWNDFATKLNVLLALPDAERRSLVEANYRRALENFSVDAFAKRLLDLIER